MPTTNRCENYDGVRIQATRDSTATRQLDTAFGCLRSARSRYLLYYLADYDEKVIPVEKAIEAVQKYEAASMWTDELPPRQSVRINLINVHFPRLRAAGVLIHDPQRGEIQFDGNVKLEEWLEQSRQLELN